MGDLPGPDAADRVLADLPDLTVVLRHPDADVGPLPPGLRVVDLPVRDAGQVPRRTDAVLLLAPDRDALQRCVSVLRGLPKVTSLWLWLTDSETLPGVVPGRGLPAVVDSRAQRVGAGWIAAVTFAEKVAVRAAATAMAHSLFTHRTAAPEGLRLALQVGAAGLPGLDRPALVADPLVLAQEETVVPPDVVVTPGAETGELPPHPVLPLRIRLLGEDSAQMGLGPLDQRIFNPAGFLRSEVSGAARLALREGRLELTTPAGHLSASADRGVTEAMVAALRPVRTVSVSWPAEPQPALARGVAALAMSGVPVSGAAPGWAGPMLGETVTGLLAVPYDASDDERREEHSVLLRRAALRTLSDEAWRRRLAGWVGIAPAPRTTVSLLLATRRPEQLAFALRQVRRQAGVDLELVLAAHGFTPDPAVVADHLGPDLPVVIRSHPAETLFGDVLRDAAAAAGGDLLLKVDDDDWYGPDFVSDLLLARRYSGADLVGVPLQYVYLVTQRRTLLRAYRSECDIGIVAGGSMLLSPELLAEVGGVRAACRWVDASLLADVRAVGGRIYRTHGLGYVFRRGDSGHTWQVGTDHFADDDRTIAARSGFAPSRLLAPDQEDRPG